MFSSDTEIMGTQFWRLIVIALGGKDPASAEPARLQDALIRSIG